MSFSLRGGRSSKLKIENGAVLETQANAFVAASTYYKYATVAYVPPYQYCKNVRSTS
jgi:hypothetical protein